MASQKLFGNRIDPACSHCLHSNAVDGFHMLTCPLVGIVEPFFFCERYEYDPIKRRPSPLMNLPDFSPDDFKV